jgi:hypothetical protein
VQRSPERAVNTWRTFAARLFVSSCAWHFIFMLLGFACGCVSLVWQ